MELDYIFRILIDHGADKEETFMNMTPLHYAIYKKIESLACILVENGANLDAMYNDQTPLHHAIATQCTTVVKKLLESKVDTERLYNGMTPLHHAIKQKQSHIVELLLHKNIDTEFHYNGMSPLHHAIKKGDTKSVKLLLDFKVNYESEYHGMTPLHHAIQSNCADIAEFLIDFGVDLERKYKGLTPLAHAIAKNSYFIAALLLEDNVNSEGIPDIIVAIIANYIEKFEDCLSKKESIGEKYENKLPIHFAIICNRPTMLQRLIKSGASIESKYKDKSPLHLAISYRNLDVVNILLEAGANTESTYKRKTALQYAVVKQTKEIAFALLKHGANKDTPFEILKNANSKILSILKPYCTIFGVPYRFIFNNIKSENIDLDAFLAADDPILFLEEHNYSTEVTLQALRLLNGANVIDICENNRRLDEENVMEDSKVLRANHFFKNTIQPHFKNTLLSYSKNHDYEEALNTISTAIKELILDNVLAEAKDHNNSTLIHFIISNRDKLIQSDESVLKESIPIFSCANSSTQAAWRGFNPFAPVAGDWPNLLIKAQESTTIFTGIAHTEDLDLRTAYEILRERIAYYYLAVIDPHDGDDATRATRVQNFIQQLYSIRNAHGLDDPSCFPGCVTRIADMGAFHSVAQLPITIKDWARNYFTEKALGVFRASLEELGSEETKQNLLNALITMTTDNAQSIIVKPENYNFSLLALRHEFIAKLGTAEENFDFISHNNLYPIVEQDQIYIEHTINDIGSGGTGIALAEQFDKYIDKVPTSEDIACANPFSPVHN
ncbi:MAG TPA: ankyrin repeat domain-containing protein, partial [Gammaproteobacteria bacterium]|nr:ankyrin repeat domain-containing protein [Gammaproteobacteria bacterium]